MRNKIIDDAIATFGRLQVRLAQEVHPSLGNCHLFHLQLRHSHYVERSFFNHGFILSLSAAVSLLGFLNFDRFLGSFVHAVPRKYFLIVGKLTTSLLRMTVSGVI